MHMVLIRRQVPHRSIDISLDFMKSEWKAAIWLGMVSARRSASMTKVWLPYDNNPRAAARRRPDA